MSFEIFPNDVMQHCLRYIREDPPSILHLSSTNLRFRTSLAPELFRSPVFRSARQLHLFHTQTFPRHHPSVTSLFALSLNKYELVTYGHIDALLSMLRTSAPSLTHLHLNSFLFAKFWREKVDSFVLTPGLTFSSLKEVHLEMEDEGKWDKFLEILPQSITKLKLLGMNIEKHVPKLSHLHHLEELYFRFDWRSRCHSKGEVSPFLPIVENLSSLKKVINLSFNSSLNDSDSYALDWKVILLCNTHSLQCFDDEVFLRLRMFETLPSPLTIQTAASLVLNQAKKINFRVYKSFWSSRNYETYQSLLEALQYVPLRANLHLSGSWEDHLPSLDLLVEKGTQIQELTLDFPNEVPSAMILKCQQFLTICPSCSKFTVSDKLYRKIYNNIPPLEVLSIKLFNRSEMHNLPTGCFSHVENIELIFTNDFLSPLDLKEMMRSLDQLCPPYPKSLKATGKVVIEDEEVWWKEGGEEEVLTLFWVKRLCEKMKKTYLTTWTCPISFNMSIYFSIQDKIEL